MVRALLVVQMLSGNPIRPRQPALAPARGFAL